MNPQFWENSGLFGYNLFKVSHIRLRHLTMQQFSPYFVCQMSWFILCKNWTVKEVVYWCLFILFKLLWWLRWGKYLPAMQETWVWSLSQKDPLEKRMATDSSILAWKTSTNKGAWLATVYVVTESDMTEQLTYTHTLKSPLDCKEIKPVNPKGNQSWILVRRIDAEAPILWPPDMKSQLIGKDPKAGKDWRQEEKRAAENEMVRQHHRFNGHEREQTPGDSEGQGNQACCSSWYHKESDTT